MSASNPAPDQQNESLDELFGSVFDLAGQIASRITRDEVEVRLRRTLREAGRPAPTALAGHASLAAMVNCAAAGDQDAWDWIIERYAPLVYATCRRYRLPAHDVEDVGQRVWLLLLEQIGHLREPAALPGWLATTTSRECLRALRAAQRSQPLPGWSADNAMDDATVDATVDAKILAVQRDAALHAAMAGLPVRCRRLLAMLVSDPPHSYAEISAELGIPMGSIGPQRSRCLERLRRSITVTALGEDMTELKPGLPPEPGRTPPRT
jgi:RNA polymerase sigma factor (sigma-70 family)